MNLGWARATGNVLIEAVFGAGYALWLMGRAFGYATPAQVMRRPPLVGPVRRRLSYRPRIDA